MGLLRGGFVCRYARVAVRLRAKITPIVAGMMVGADLIDDLAVIRQGAVIASTVADCRHHPQPHPRCRVPGQLVHARAGTGTIRRHLIILPARTA